jgi:dTDP-4-dehydrorhamnose 3,5-epimerase
VIFKETYLSEAFVIEPEKLEDERGFFARSFCRKEYKNYGLNPRVTQCNISFNLKRGTLRGMHYQVSPFEEAKLVRCTRGAIHDIIVDIRPESLTFKGHFGLTLTAENRRMLYIPEGFAHGFLTLEDNTEVFYQMSEFYDPASARGFRWNDPGFSITWPASIEVISERDRNYPDFIRDQGA